MSGVGSFAFNFDDLESTEDGNQSYNYYMF